MRPVSAVSEDHYWEGLMGASHGLLCSLSNELRNRNLSGD